jgi:hypothetical protein
VEIDGLLIYALVAILLLVVSVVLFRKGTSSSPEVVAEEPPGGIGQLDVTSLRLAERIFDSSDRDWLRKELCFPEAAVVLERHRKALAIQWLKNLRNSFKEFVRTPEHPAEAFVAQNAPSSLELLALTLRFHLLINYALLIVSLFGPYHRMIPILGTVRSVQRLGAWKAGFDQVSTGQTP